MMFKLQQYLYDFKTLFVFCLPDPEEIYCCKIPFVCGHIDYVIWSLNRQLDAGGGFYLYDNVDVMQFDMS